jgi:GNAT superfamily N-acetyltransferase
MPVAFGRGKGRSNPAVHWHRQGLPDTTSWMARSRIQDEDREEVAEFVEKHWRSRLVMSRGRAFYPHKEEGFIERRDGRIAGLLTFRVDEEGLEILTLNSVLEGAGIGSSLILDAIQEARTRRCTRVWFTTTNDNIKGFRFYQRLGFRLVAVNVGVVDEARKVKPQIPEIGQDGIPVHDEIVLELRIEPYLDPPGAGI